MTDNTEKANSERQLSNFGTSLPIPGGQTATSAELHFRVLQLLLGLVEFLLFQVAA